MFIKGLLQFEVSGVSVKGIDSGESSARANKIFKSSSKNIIQSVRYIFLKYQILLSGSINPCAKDHSYYSLKLPQLYMTTSDMKVCNYTFTYFEFNNIL